VLSLPLHTQRMLGLCSFQSPTKTGSMLEYEHKLIDG